MLFILICFTSINTHGESLALKDKPSSSEKWQKVFSPRKKHNLAFFTGSYSGNWRSEHMELPNHSTDFILSYRYHYGGFNNNTSFFLGSQLGYSVDSHNRFSNYLGSKFLLPGLVAGISYNFSAKLRLAFAMNFSLTRYTNLELNNKNYRLASEHLRDFFLSVEYFFSQDWGVITCLNYRGELFLDDNLSFKNDVRNSVALMAGLTYHKL